MRAALSLDGASILIIGQRWREKITIADLQGRLDLYRKLRDRDAPRDRAGKVIRQGPYHKFYEQTVQELEKIETKIGKAKST